MTQDENVKEINSENANASTKTSKKTVKIERPDFNPTTAEGQKALEKWIEDRAKASAIKNQVLCSKVVLINKGTKDEYALLLHYPGTVEASNIQTEAMTESGNLSLGKLMQGAVDHGVIVAPKITDIDEFASTHKYFGEAGNQVFNFLNDGIAGKLK